MRLNVATQPASEPVDLTTAKLQCRIDTAITTWDAAYLPMLIKSARRACEARIHQCFCNQTIDLYLDSWGQQYPGVNYWGNVTGSSFYLNPYPTQVLLPHEPVSAVSYVKYKDQTGTLVTWDTSSYVVSTGQGARIAPASGYFPILANSIDAVQIRYVAGYSADGTSVPEPIKSAILLWVAHLFRSRLAAEDATLDAIPFGVDDLLNSVSSGRQYFA